MGRVRRIDRAVAEPATRWPRHVVIAEGHDKVRHGLRRLIQDEPSYLGVGEARSAMGAAHIIKRTNADILLLDHALLQRRGLKFVRALKLSFPHVEVVLLALFDGAAMILEAQDAGVLGFVMKSADQDHVVTALDEAAAGRIYLSPAVVEVLVGVDATRSTPGAP